MKKSWKYCFKNTHVHYLQSTRGEREGKLLFFDGFAKKFEQYAEVVFSRNMLTCHSMNVHSIFE